MTVEDMMPDPSPVMLGEMNLYLIAIDCFVKYSEAKCQGKSIYFQTVQVTFSEIFIDLWYNYIIDKPYAVVTRIIQPLKTPRCVQIL